MTNLAIRVENLGRLSYIGPRERDKSDAIDAIDATHAINAARNQRKRLLNSTDPIDPTDQIRYSHADRIKD